MKMHYPNLYHPDDPNYDNNYPDIDEWYDKYDEVCEDRSEIQREEWWDDV